jgi:hypothetical protein
MHPSCGFVARDEVWRLLVEQTRTGDSQWRVGAVAAALATRLGLSLTELPGGHLGPIERPTQFAGALRALLEGR